MAENVQDWLKSIGFGQYVDAFVENGVDFELLSHLNNEDLKDLGISMLGDRKKLLLTIEQLDPKADIPPNEIASPDVLSEGHSDAERRQLTVMFCDLVGSTTLSERLDPEDMRNVLRAYQETCAEAVGRFDGHVAKYIGDGLLVYFGYPQAHEDDPQRAVRAGLGVIEGVAALNPRLGTEHGIELGVRVGIHTGLVVAGEMGGGATREQYAIVGETPNIASRLEGLAEPGTMVISDATHRLVDGFFDCEELGQKSLKGVSEPVRVFQVRRENPSLSRFETTDARGLTPLVGREEEIALLMKRWEQARDGEGQVVLLSGEAGVGKSRILRGFRERLEDESYSRVLYYGSTFHQNSAFYPVIDQIERAMRFAREDTANDKLHKLEATLTALGLALPESVPPVAALLNLDMGDRYPRAKVSPQQLKAMILEALVSVVEAMAKKQPVLIVLEDVHWADPSTRELFELYVERLRKARVLVLITFRPEFEPPWSGHAHATALALNRLTRREAAELVAKITGGKPLPIEILDQIIERTDGVPLYVEELTKTVLESDLVAEEDHQYVLLGPLPDLVVPASLQDSLMARLDRLATVKEVAQLAAVIGRVFEQELLAAVSPLEEAALTDALEQLVEAELVFRRGLPPHASYEFKHALVQDVAYQSLLKSTRHQYHHRIAQTLAECYPEILETQPELLARHYTEARLPEQAIPFWHKAAEHAALRSASQEVIAHSDRALELLQVLPVSVSRDQQELGLLLTSGPAHMVATGFASPESGRTYKRAHELASKLGNDSALFTVTWGLWINHQQQAKIELARGLAKDVATIAQRHGDPEMELQAHHASWTTHLVLADHQTVRENVEKGLAIYDPDKHRSHAYRYGGHDPGVCALVHGAEMSWIEGYPDQSERYARQAIELADKVAHPASLGIAHAFGSIVQQHRAEIVEVLNSAQQTINVCSENGVLHHLTFGHILHGWALVSAGEIEPGITEMLHGLDAHRKTGAALRHSYFLTLLAEAYGMAGQFTEALKTIDDAYQAVEKVGEQWWHAEVQRVRGELLLARSTGDTSEAETCFRKAVEIARSQGAKSLELRAATSMARPWIEAGRREEARETLAPVYGWFTEGFDTPDLLDAKALLDELS